MYLEGGATADTHEKVWQHACRNWLPQRVRAENRYNIPTLKHYLTPNEVRRRREAVTQKAGREPGGQNKIQTGDVQTGAGGRQPANALVPFTTSSSRKSLACLTA